jgi:hypothetical protein
VPGAWNAPLVARPLAVVDLDGVVADVRHRLHHLDCAPKDWPAFFAGIPDDPPLAEGVRAVQELSAAADLVYLTGRPEWTRAATEAWLRRHGLPPGRLVMRRADDRRPARTTKADLLAELAAGREVLAVLDDDPEVCAALRAAGWPVRLATWMPRPAGLARAQERDGRT